MKNRILRTPEDLKRGASSLLGLEQYLPIKVSVEQYKPTRSVEQNDKFHAICADISRQRQWAGQRMDVEDWKRLLVDLYVREMENKPARVVPSLDGKGVVALGEQTRNMNTARMSGLIEFSTAWAIDENIELRE